jgi:hypothetical protein
MERPAKNAPCDLRVEPLADGTLVLDERPDPGSFQVPGKSYNSASSYGKPFTLQLTDTVDGALGPAATPEPREP